MSFRWFHALVSPKLGSTLLFREFPSLEKMSDAHGSLSDDVLHVPLGP